jgi:hypothetical protein
MFTLDVLGRASGLALHGSTSKLGGPEVALCLSGKPLSIVLPLLMFRVVCAACLLVVTILSQLVCDDLSSASASSSMISMALIGLKSLCF